VLSATPPGITVQAEATTAVRAALTHVPAERPVASSIEPASARKEAKSSPSPKQAALAPEVSDRTLAMTPAQPMHEVTASKCTQTESVVVLKDAVKEISSRLVVSIPEIDLTGGCQMKAADAIRRFSTVRISITLDLCVAGRFHVAKATPRSRR
jgi:hypothetical protein